LPLEIFLFSDTHCRHIAFGRPTPAARSEIVPKGPRARRHNGFEKGYDTMNRGEGRNAFRRQKQRLANARAFRMDPTCSFWRQSLRGVHKTRGYLEQIVVSQGQDHRDDRHRISSIQHAHQIIGWRTGALPTRRTHWWRWRHLPLPVEKQQREEKLENDK
jgi:ABC-type multidrug transport system fused ATPase/permease subunit